MLRVRREHLLTLEGTQRFVLQSKKGGGSMLVQSQVAMPAPEAKFSLPPFGVALILSAPKVHLNHMTLEGAVFRSRDDIQ